MFSGKSAVIRLRVLLVPDKEVKLCNGLSCLLSFVFEEYILIASSRAAAAMEEGLYSKKAAVRIVFKHKPLAIMSIYLFYGSLKLSTSKMRWNRSRKGSGEM